MRLALLHRRLTAGMALAALAAFAAGDGLTPTTLLAALALAVPLGWLPDARASRWIETASRVGIVALFAWATYVAFVLVRDFMPAVLAMLLFLLIAENLRALEAKNDLRLYLLSFSLLIAATAYYPGLAFAAAFIAYIVLATLGLMAGYLRRQAERFRVADLKIGARSLWATAALSGVTLFISALLFVVFPRLPRQWNVQGRPGGGDAMAGFADEVDLGQHGGRIVANPDVMFRVEFPAGPPAGPEQIYWRGRSFDRFDGRRWSRSPRYAATAPTPRFYASRWGGRFGRVRIFGGPPGAPVLFGPHPVLDVDGHSAIRVFRDGTGDIVYFNSDNPVYSVTYATGRPSDEALRADTGTDLPTLRRYLALPPALDPRVARLADSLTAGAATRIDQVRAVERWLSTSLGYTTELPDTRRDATVEGFLFRRREGHCEYFSTALALLLRAEGIPARNVTGFLGGEWNENGGYLAVTGNDAHSWVEVWFPGYGWVPFDATPPGRADAVGSEAWEGWAWPAFFWLDGVEYRWHKWVVDYNLERQITLFRSIGDLFSRGNGGGSGSADRDRGGTGFRDALPWIVLVGGLGWAVWGFRRRTGAALPPEARAYLALRRRYARAGYAPRKDGGVGPLAFAEILRRQDAPGAGEAGRVVDLYVRARFSGQELREEDRMELRASADAAKEALRRAPKRRTPAGVA